MIGTRLFRILAVTTVLSVVVALAATNVFAAPAPPKTLDNLMAAFNGESNANAMYIEFAK